MAQCKYNLGGKQCRAYALKGGEFCFTHQPGLEQERLKGRSRGGSKKRVYKPLPKVNLKTPQHVQIHLEEITNLVRANEIEDKKAQLLQKLSDSLLKSLELGELAEKLEELENYAEKRSF